jgi:hypothetical protein
LVTKAGNGKPVSTTEFFLGKDPYKTFSAIKNVEPKNIDIVILKKKKNPILIMFNKAKRKFYLKKKKKKKKERGKRRRNCLVTSYNILIHI